MAKIILLRHGEVKISSKHKITANEFNKWVKKYNNADIRKKLVNKNEIQSLLNTSDTIFCSALSRSIQSIKFFTKIPNEKNDIFNEAEIPRSKGDFFKLSPNIWLKLYRALWLLGYCKGCESLRETQIRARLASQHLINSAHKDEVVVLAGHGIINKLIRKELMSKNWTESKKSNNHHWSYGVYELNT